MRTGDAFKEFPISIGLVPDSEQRGVRLPVPNPAGEAVECGEALGYERFDRLSRPGRVRGAGSELLPTEAVRRIGKSEPCRQGVCVRRHVVERQAGWRQACRRQACPSLEGTGARGSSGQSRPRLSPASGGLCRPACADLSVPTWEVGVPLPARCRARGGARREVHHHGTGKYAASRPPPAGCADQRSAFQAVPALFPDRCCAVSLRFAQRCRCEHRRSLAPLPPYRRRWR